MLHRFNSSGPPDSRLAAMVCLSLLLHGAIFSLLLLSPSFPTPKRTFGPAYSVSLVSSPGTLREQRSNATAAARELGSARSVQPAAAVKKQLDPAPVVPLQSLKARPQVTDPSLESAMAEIRKRAAAPPAGSAVPQAKAPVAQERQAGQAAAGPSAAGPSAAGGGGGAPGATQESYYALLWSRIKGQWVLPPGILSDEQLEAVIGIAMLRNGAVTAIYFEKRSGNRYFDDSALKAIEKATPFPPLPDGVGGKSLEVGVRFHSAELRR